MKAARGRTGKVSAGSVLLVYGVKSRQKDVRFISVRENVVVNLFVLSPQGNWVSFSYGLAIPQVASFLR